MRGSMCQCQAAGSKSSRMRSNSFGPCTNSNDGTEPAMRPSASKCTPLLASPSKTHGDCLMSPVSAVDCPQRSRDPLGAWRMNTSAPRRACAACGTSTGIRVRPSPAIASDSLPRSSGKAKASEELTNDRDRQPCTRTVSASGSSTTPSSPSIVQPCRASAKASVDFPLPLSPTNTYASPLSIDDCGGVHVVTIVLPKSKDRSDARERLTSAFRGGLVSAPRESRPPATWSSAFSPRCRSVDFGVRGDTFDAVRAPLLLNKASEWMPHPTPNCLRTRDRPAAVIEALLNRCLQEQSRLRHADCVSAVSVECGARLGVIHVDARRESHASRHCCLRRRTRWRRRSEMIHSWRPRTPIS